jgi:hypothetical protein
MSRSLRERVAASSSSFIVTPQRWQSIKCRAIPSGTRVFAYLGVDRRTILALAHLTVLPPLPLIISLLALLALPVLPVLPALALLAVLLLVVAVIRALLAALDLRYVKTPLAAYQTSGHIRI